MQQVGCPYGTHRTGGGMPQPAEALDASMDVYAGEIRLDVELLNIDSSSMRQMAVAAGGDPDGVAETIREIVARRGKMHNPMTNSGGCMVGRVAEVGAAASARGVVPGDRLCPIVSLSLIPLRIDQIFSVDIARSQVALTGSAILFQTAVFGVMPNDFATAAAIAVIDVCGAPARLLRMARPGQTVGVLGAGKAGLLSAVAAREAVGPAGRVVLADVDRRSLEAATALGVVDEVVVLDLTRPVEAAREVARVTGGTMFDLSVNVANVPGTEGATILATRPGGRVLFFGMATNFQAAALGAEGVGRDVEMVIGNGYVDGCIETAFDIVRRAPALRAILESSFGAADARGRLP